MRLLLVEDERGMAELLRQGLRQEGYSVLVARNGREALELACTAEWDLLVLDVMLPEIDGYEVARRLRRERVLTPILMLTARDGAADVIHGLDCGADDYLAKPFAFEVLLARLRALARRGPAKSPPILRVADLTLDPACRSASRGRREISLSKTEFNLLEVLMRRPGQVVPRNLLIEMVWGFDGEIEGNTLDAFIRLLRRKVDRPGSKKLIHTVRGVGHCVREELPR